MTQHPQPSSCCDLCQKLSLQDFWRGTTLPLEPFLSAWKRSENAGPEACSLCTLMNRALGWKGMWSFDVLHLTWNTCEQAVVLVATTERVLREGVEVQMLCSYQGKEWLPDYLVDKRIVANFLRVFQLSDQAGPSKFRYRLPSSFTGPETRFALIRRWLKRCRSTHPAPCRQSNRYTPSRLVAINSEGQKVSLRLVTSTSTPIDVEYAALSYCWGSTAFLTTTSANLASLQQSIPVDKLPQSILDAIEVTQKLGLYYLWVDALCVVQGTDDQARKDWNSESKKMNLIYGGACVTIVAENASQAADGFLNSQLLAPTSYASIPWSKDEPSTHYLGAWEERLFREPLHSRGWALQESLMSNRMLKFGTAQVSWSCSHANETECEVESWANEDENRQAASQVEQELSLNDLERPGIDETHNATEVAHEDVSAVPDTMTRKGVTTYKDWQHIVEKYTACSLTKPTDRLPAISGLAETIKREVDDVFEAGMWKSRLREDLLWKRRTPMRQADGSYQARLWASRSRQGVPWKQNTATKEVKRLSQEPSWSWISIDGPVAFVKSTGDTVEHPIDFVWSRKYTTSHKWPALKIQGFITHRNTIRYKPCAEYYGGYEGFLPWAYLPTTLKTTLDTMEDIPPCHIRRRSNAPEELIDTWLFSQEQVTDGYGYWTGAFCCGIILISVPGRPMCFRRIGFFEGLPNERCYWTRPELEPSRAERVRRCAGRYYETASLLRLQGCSKEWREWHRLRYITSRRTVKSMAIPVELYIV